MPGKIMSEIAKIIDQVIKEHIAPLMKERSFKKKARTFHKQSNDATLVVNIQASQWNQGVEGQFTVNLGAYFPDVETICESLPVKGIPKEYNNTVRKRIGQTMPSNCDKWWEIKPSTNLGNLGSDVALALSEYGLPWLQSMSTKESIKNELVAQRQYLRAAGLSLLNGCADEAKGFVQKQLKDKPLAASRTKSWAKRHGLL